MSDKKKTPCILPWTHLASDPAGTFRPCCIAKDLLNDKHYIYNIKNDRINDVLNSPQMRSIRNSFREGKFPKTCEICKVNEKNGIESKREQHLDWLHQRHLPHPNFDKEPDAVSDLQIILSNKCNLKCRTCNAIYSTKWTQESLDRNIIRFNKFLPPLDSNLSSKIFQTIDEWSPRVRHIEYMGGEPLIQNEFLKLTDKLIEGGFSKQIQLSFSTNAAIDGTDIVNRLSANFEKVSINLSIDGVKERFEYLRHGAKWGEVSRHLLSYYLLSKKNSNLSVGITHTVSWLNAFYVPEIFELVNSLTPSLQIHINLVFNPNYLNCSILPAEVNRKIIDHLKKYITQNPLSEKAIRTLMQHLENAYPHRILFEEGILINKDADKYRNESFAETFPEFYALIEKYYSKAKPRRWSFKILNNFFNRWGIFDFIYD